MFNAKSFCHTTTLAFVLGTLLTACSEPPSTEGETEESIDQVNSAQEDTKNDQPSEMEPEQLAVYSLIDQAHENSLNLAGQLKEETERFLNAPDEQSYKRLLDAYNKAHQAYRIADVSLSMITSLEPLRLQVDAFPILPGYLDSVDGYPNSGLIHSEIPINIETLLNEHQFSDPYYLTLGFHPFAFILEGDPGEAIVSWKRLVVEGTPKNKVAAKRRRIYLELLAKRLMLDISALTQQWKALPKPDLSVLEHSETRSALLETEHEHSGEVDSQAVSDHIAEITRLLANLRTEVKP